MSAKRGERILGPYEDRNGWRVIEVDAAGKRGSTVFETEDKARRYIDLLSASLSTEPHTTETALEEYLKHLEREGTKPQSRSVTAWAIGLFFPEPILLSMLSSRRCLTLYENLTERVSERTKRRISVDTHRNARDRVSCFLSWCTHRGWIRENPMKGGKVRGVGRRRLRGKSLGLAGNELRIKQARVWYEKALELANQGDDGATAGLMALLLGMRAGEIVTRKVGDLDSEAQPADLLWIPCAKTPAGRRTLEVPEVLRQLIASLAKGKADDAYLLTSKRSHGKPHNNQWPLAQVRRICRLVGVPEVTAHAMRGFLATLASERGVAGHVIAATLGHESFEGMTNKHYAAPGSATAGAIRRGWSVLDGGGRSAG